MPRSPEISGPRDFKVNVLVRDVEVTAVVDLENSAFNGAPAEIAFYLISDNKPVWRGSYSASTHALFVIETPGTYTVKAFVRTGDHKLSRHSEPFTITHETLQASTISGDRITENLRFAPLDYPHQDFALVSFRKQPNGIGLIQSQLDELGMNAQRWGNAHEPIYAIAPKKVQNSEVLFSGMTRTSTRFVFGDQDIEGTDPADYLDNVGDFTVATRQPWGATISTDYFGVGKIYYYCSTRVTCVSNRYHLLLLLLNSIGEPLCLDRVKARATLQAVNQPFTQNFSTGMEVAGCEIVRPGHMVHMSGVDLEFVETGISRVLSEPTDQELSPDYYWRQIKAAGEEIVSNLRVSLEHPAFDNIRVDVTGGLDARLLFTALARHQDFRDKIHIHTADVAGSPHDLEISLALTREAGFNYDTLPRETNPVSLSTSLLENISYNLGSYYGIRAESRRSRLPNTLRINGFYGEACARPYFARLIFGKDSEHLSPGDFSQRYIGSIADTELPLPRQDELTSLFRNEIEALPGHTAADRMDAFYIAYRNGLHCSDRWLNHTLAPGWGPLQSKELFELKWKSLNTLKNIKVQVDLTEYLNAELAQLPIGRTKDNADRHALDPKYPSALADVEALLNVSEEDHARYQQASKIRGSKVLRIPTCEAQPIEIENKTFDKVSSEGIKVAINSLTEDFDVLSDNESETLKRYVETHFVGVSRPSHRGIVIANKILSLYHQCKLVATQVENRD